MHKKDKKQKSNEVFHERNRLMPVNAWLSQEQNYNRVYAIIAFFAFLLILWVLYSIESLPGWLSFDDEVNVEEIPFNPIQLIGKHPIITIVGIAMILVGYGFFVYKIHIAYAPLNIGQRGTQRWTSREELKAQYKAVPEKKERFPGGGGVPISRAENHIFIDDSPVNNLIIGITRSGKGELVVFPEIDIYSRAEKQASMIITDPKLELAPATIPRLIELGYECHVLNLIDPDYSMGYNPLALCLEEYKKGNEDDAKLLCGAFCFSIFNPDQATGDNKFFEDNSTTLLTALILATIEDNLEADRQFNEKNRIKFEKNERQRKEKALLALDTEQRKIYNLQESFEHLIKIDPLITENELATELGISFNRLKEIKSEDKKKINYIKREYKPSYPNEKKVNMYSVINTFSVLASKRVSTTETMLDKYFSDRPEGNTARLLYASTGIAGDKTKGSIYSNMLTALKVFNYENIARMTARSTINMKEIGFGGKPIAIFIGMPDYDKSNYFLATAFIRQMYFTLAKLASHAPGQKCPREVIFLLDEFGNIPPIENLATIITICLGRNIRFNLIIQAFAQIHKLYGEDANTIIGNCGNHIYIQTSDEDTAEKFSSQLGSETIVNVNRTGKIFSLDKERTEMAEERRLLDQNELMRLMPGETVVNRVMKRQDLNGTGIIPYPICNMGDDKLKFRFEYLLDFFPSGNILYDSPLTSEVFKMIRQQQKEMLECVAAEKFMSIDDFILMNDQNIDISLIKDPNPIDVEVETTLHIDLSEHLWSAEAYAKTYQPVNQYLNQDELYKLCTLIAFDSETKQFVNEGKIMTYQILKVINEKISSSNVDDKEIGYKAYDLLFEIYEDDTEQEVTEIWEQIRHQAIVPYCESIKFKGNGFLANEVENLKETQKNSYRNRRFR